MNKHIERMNSSTTLSISQQKWCFLYCTHIQKKPWLEIHLWTFLKSNYLGEFDVAAEIGAWFKAEVKGGGGGSKAGGNGGKELNIRGWGIGAEQGTVATGPGPGGKTMGNRPWRWASFNLAAICFFHFVRRFWNQVLICTSVKLRLLDSSRRLETERYLSVCKQKWAN